MRNTFAVLAVLAITPVFGQAPPSFAPGQLDRMVSRIALYPDPLLAQILAAATYSGQIPDAARWADEHHYLTGPALANAINADQLPWDPSVQALLPFPSVLGMMASDLDWTRDLGDAFLAQRDDVMQAVQRMRRQAYRFGYLRSNAEVVVRDGAYISVLPARPDYIVVPYYNAAVVFGRPGPGISIGAAIRFGYGVSIGAAFQPWGWGYNRFDWGTHLVIINNAPWRRTWDNRRAYVHPYELRRYEAPHRVEERHELRGRDEHERDVEREGRGRVEDHRGRGEDRGKGRGRGHNHDHDDR
jgi:Protein of unknown function (DUF3300)